MPEGVNRFDRERAVVDGGYWARMSHLERGVWFVLLKQSDFETGEVRMGMVTIAQRAGISNLHRARQACQQIEMQGLCRTVHAGGGKDHAAVRVMLAPEPLRPLPWEETVDLFSGHPETGTVSVPVTRRMKPSNRDAGRAHTGTVSRPNRDAGRAQTGTVGVPRSHRSHRSPPPEQQTGTVGGPVSSFSASPPVAPRMKRAEAGPGKAGREKEEEVASGLVKKLTGRGLWVSTARQFEAGGLTDSQADQVWREVVNDRGVRDRGKVYHRRLREFLQAGQ